MWCLSGAVLKHSLRLVDWDPPPPHMDAAYTTAALGTEQGLRDLTLWVCFFTIVLLNSSN